MSNELATTQQEPSVALANRPVTTGDLIAATLQSGITESTVAVVERLCALRERENAAQAERDFAVAFVRLQSSMPKIVACKAVPGNDGTVRYKFAPYEEIMTKARPALNECGFGITFDTDISEGRVTATCTLIHVGGHSISKKFACRIGSGPPKASEAQGDGAAVTYAKRFALCAALNIVVEQDTDGSDDARNLGAHITQEQADDLRRRVRDTKADEAKFLDFAGAKTFEEIYNSRWSELDEVLRKREAKKSSEPKRPLDPQDKDGNFQF